jgi:hypothetical protein
LPLLPQRGAESSVAGRQLISIDPQVLALPFSRSVASDSFAVKKHVAAAEHAPAIAARRRRGAARGHVAKIRGVGERLAQRLTAELAACLRVYREGTLSIEIFDGATRQPVWHGRARKEITGADESDPQPVIRKAVAAILGKFPSHAAGSSK